jgi:16S rRNA G1207 methylase RsmC
MQDLRNSPSKILDVCAGSGQLAKVLGRLESTQEIRMLDMSGKPVSSATFLLLPRANLY